MIGGSVRRTAMMVFFASTATPVTSPHCCPAGRVPQLSTRVKPGAAARRWTVATTSAHSRKGRQHADDRFVKDAGMWAPFRSICEHVFAYAERLIVPRRQLCQGPAAAVIAE